MKPVGEREAMENLIKIVKETEKNSKLSSRDLLVLGWISALTFIVNGGKMGDDLKVDEKYEN